MRRDFSPPGMHSNLGMPFHKFDAVGGPPPHGVFHPHDDRAPFMHNIHRLGGPPHLSERRPWGPQVFSCCMAFLHYSYLSFPTFFNFC